MSCCYADLAFRPHFWPLLVCVVLLVEISSLYTSPQPMVCIFIGMKTCFSSRCIVKLLYQIP